AADDPVRRAEAALARLSGEFASWMAAECDRLDAARRDARARGFSRFTRDALFNAAHDIKGEAATFGFPAVAAPAESLCRLIEYTPDPARIPMSLVDQPLDAIRAILPEGARVAVADVAAPLTRRVGRVTDELP